VNTDGDGCTCTVYRVDIGIYIQKRLVQFSGKVESGRSDSDSSDSDVM
jgi:hypothetical protein